MIERVLDERVLVDVGVLGGHDEGLDRLAGVWMWHTDHGRLLDLGMPGEHVFHLGRVDVEPRHDHEVLGAVDEIEVAVVVDGRHVAGLQPTVLGEDGVGCIGVLVVAGEDVVAAHPDLAGVTDQGVTAGLAHEPDLDALEGATDRTESHLAPHTGGTRRRRLGQPVALVDRDTEAVEHLLRDGDRQLRRTRQGEPDRGEGVRVQFVEVGERRPHRRGAGHDGDLAALDRLGSRQGVEPLDQDERRADAEPERHDDVQPEDVEQREHRVDDVALFRPVLRRVALVQAGPQVAVGEHGGTRVAGGAAGEHQGGQLILVDLHAFDRLVLEQLVHRDRVLGDVVRIAGDDGLDRRHPLPIHVQPGRGARLLDDDHLRADLVDLGFELRSGAQRIERHGDRAETEGREVGDDEVGGVAAEQDHPVALADTHRGQPAAQAVDLVAQLAVRDRLVPEDQRGPIGVVSVENARKVHLFPHRSPARRLVPTKPENDTSGALGPGRTANVEFAIRLGRSSPCRSGVAVRFAAAR